MRDAKIVAIVGRRKSGKTTYTKKKINEYVNALSSAGHSYKVLVVDTFDNEGYREGFPIIKPVELIGWKKGVCRMIIPSLEELLPYIESGHLYNCLLIIEDAVKFLSPNTTKQEKALFADTKQKGIDVIALFHAFSFVPNGFIYFCDAVQVFKTNDSIQKVRSKIQYQEIEDAWILAKESPNPFFNSRVWIN